MMWQEKISLYNNTWIRSFCFVLLALILASCASLQNFQAPVNTKDKIMAAYASIGAAYKTVADLANRQQISRTQGQKLIASIDKAKNMVGDAEVVLKGGDTKTSEQTLKLVNAILSQVELETKDLKGK